MMFLWYFILLRKEYYAVDLDVTKVLFNITLGSTYHVLVVVNNIGQAVLSNIEECDLINLFNCKY